jgi:death on curing protein
MKGQALLEYPVIIEALTGFVVGVLFLELNGAAFAAPEEDATQAVLSLADGSLDEAGYTAFLRANTKLP